MVKIKVILLGQANVGKTSIGKYLKFLDRTIALDTEPSTRIEKYLLRVLKADVSLFVTPGQRRFRETNIEFMLKLIDDRTVVFYVIDSSAGKEKIKLMLKEFVDEVTKLMNENERLREELDAFKELPTVDRLVDYMEELGLDVQVIERGKAVSEGGYLVEVAVLKVGQRYVAIAAEHEFGGDYEIVAFKHPVTIDEFKKKIEDLEKTISELRKREPMTDIKEVFEGYKTDITELATRIEALEKVLNDSLTPMLQTLRSLSEAIKSMKKK